MKNLTWQSIVLVAVLGGLGVALLTLTSLSSGEVMGILGVLAGIGGGAALAEARNGNVPDRVEQIAVETQAQTETLNTVARRVNGELDSRIKQAVDDGNADLIRLLREQGLLR
jgi:hypothetical protein